MQTILFSNPFQALSKPDIDSFAAAEAAAACWNYPCHPRWSQRETPLISSNARRRRESPLRRALLSGGTHVGSVSPSRVAEEKSHRRCSRRLATAAPLKKGHKPLSPLFDPETLN